VHNVTVRNVRMHLAGHGVYLKSGRGRGGDIYVRAAPAAGTRRGLTASDPQDITFDGMTLEGVGIGIAISMYYTHSPPGNATSTPHMHDFVIRNVKCVSACQTPVFVCQRRVCAGVSLRRPARWSVCPNRRARGSHCKTSTSWRYAALTSASLHTARPVASSRRSAAVCWDE
jgi:hypothetical protein